MKTTILLLLILFGYSQMIVNEGSKSSTYSCYTYSGGNTECTKI